MCSYFKVFVGSAQEVESMLNDYCRDGKILVKWEMSITDNMTQVVAEFHRY